MKKSGMRAAVALPSPAPSDDAVIAPQRHEVAREVLAQRDDLALEARAQLLHERLVRWRGLAPHRAPHTAVVGSAAQSARAQRLARRARGAQHRPAPGAQVLAQAIESRGADRDRGIDLNRLEG